MALLILPCIAAMTPAFMRGRSTLAGWWLATFVQACVGTHGSEFERQLQVQQTDMYVFS
jgi:hypothetical protein